MMNGGCLFVGMGSPYGDDCVGWVIARSIAGRLGDEFTVRCARSPAVLLDWLDNFDELHVCDAFVGNGAVGTLRGWDWPAEEIELARFQGSHDLSLPAALALAAQLGRLPAKVRVWGVAVGDHASFDSMSAVIAARASEIVDQICGALGHA
ncbi:MAG: hydrogenase maturation protease [Pirellulales bacterium]